VSDYEEQDPHYVSQADELPEAERDPEIGPQEATWQDTEAALGAVHLTAAEHGAEAPETATAVRDFETAGAAYQRACERGWAAQNEANREAGQ
jgi:hypothetical protein